MTVDGRSGVLLDRIDGPPLLQVLSEASPERELDAPGRPFRRAAAKLQRAAVAGLPDLVPRLRGEIEASVPEAALRAELLALLGALDDGARGVCHFDFHPRNVLVGPDGWVVIDWLTVAAGPPAADLARTLVLWGQRATGPVGRFLRAVRREGRARQGLADEDLDAWVRVVAAARVAEGFEGEERAWLLRVASGSERLFAEPVCRRRCDQGADDAPRLTQNGVIATSASSSRARTAFSRFGTRDENKIVSSGYQRPTQARTHPARLGSV